MTALGIGLESGLEVIQESKNRITNVLFSFSVCVVALSRFCYHEMRSMWE